MKALVVYDSVYGNTEKIAQAIVGGLASLGDVEALRVGDVMPERLNGADLVVVGAPTQGSMASPNMKTWLKELKPNSLRGIKVATFDTRIAAADVNSRFLSLFARTFGYAAEKLAGELKRRGGTLVVPAEGFFVKDTEGPLREGELERAAAWGQLVASQL